MVDAAIDPPFEIPTMASIGAFCVIGWSAQPYTGVCLTPPSTVYGCNEAYWCYPSGGYPRWTTIFTGIGMHADLAYSLWEPDTAVPEAAPEIATSWGILKALYR